MKFKPQQYFFASLVAFVFVLIPDTGTAAGKNLEVEATTALRRYFGEQLHVPDQNLTVEFSRFMQPEDSFPAWDEIRVLPGKKSARSGLQIAHCGLFLHGKMVKKVSAKVRVRTFEDVVVTTDRLSRHRLLRPENLKSARLETTRSKRKVFTSVEELSGYRTSRILQAGEILDRGNVELVPIVASGSRVDIRFQKGGIEIVMPGIARQDGYRGGKILVKSPENRKVYTARVVDARTVLVEF